MRKEVRYGGIVNIEGKVEKDRKEGIEEKKREVIGKIDVLLKEEGNER